jgi:hypothetical protein
LAACSPCLEERKKRCMMICSLLSMDFMTSLWYGVVGLSYFSWLDFIYWVKKTTGSKILKICFLANLWVLVTNKLVSEFLNR